MAIIDKAKPVLVTGATGYVAGWVIKELLDHGLTVHAAVRNPDNKAKLAHLDELAANSTGSIRYFKSDLLVPGSYQEAMQGCELVFHTASPFTGNFKDPQKELIDPAVKGTTNVLESVGETSSVKRVVLTSSCVAILSDAIEFESAPGGVMNEEDWNTTSSLDYQPYSYSKTLAEQKAWEIAKSQDRWDLVVINPSFVMGPALNPQFSTSMSMDFLKQLGDGTMKVGAPKYGMGAVDVRDVGRAHYLAGFTPEAQGRYITSAHNSNFLEMAEQLLPKYGASYPIPKKGIPKWFLVAFGPLLSKQFNRRALRNNINYAWNLDNSKIQKDLGMTFRPLQESMEDGFQALIDNGILKSKK